MTTARPATWRSCAARRRSSSPTSTPPPTSATTWKVLRPWQSINIGDVNIQGVPAYTPYSAAHAREAGGLGFVISVSRFDIYYAGDTGPIPEMDRIRADIVLVPINERATMSPEEAAGVVNRMRPRFAVPYNWGSDIGASKGDALDFRRACAPTSRSC
ncbi:MAG: MBL fold metallo-hydrolase [Anaerolineae bacterium]|nr:MBL fold metallo-hydrolase [Anaerolineae bacterium]